MAVTVAVELRELRCDHLTAEQDHTEAVIWLGQQTYVLVCPFCWSAITGLVLADVLRAGVKDALRKRCGGGLA